MLDGLADKVSNRLEHGKLDRWLQDSSKDDIHDSCSDSLCDGSSNSKDVGKWLKVFDSLSEGLLDSFADRVSNSLELSKLDYLKVGILLSS